MSRNLSEPRDAGIAKRDTWVQAAGNGAGDERPAFLGQQCEYPLLRRYQRIQSCRLAVEVVSDGTLLNKLRNRDLCFSNEIRFETLNRTADFAPGIQ